MDHASLAAVVGNTSPRAALFSMLFVVVILLAVFPAHADAANEDDWFLDTVVDSRLHVEGARPPVLRPDGALTVDLSISEFLEIQRLDEGDRRTRLGLPENCIPGLTAMLRTTSPADHVVVIISCTKTP